MTSQAVWAKGTSLSKGGIVIAEQLEIGGIKLSRDAIDVSNNDTTDDYKESIPGWASVGEVSIEGNFIAGDTNGQVAMYTAFNSRAVEAYVITLPDGTTWTVSAWVKGFEIDTSSKDALKFKGSLQPVGKPTLGINLSTGASAIVVSVGTLNPAFLIGVFEYVDPVVTGTASLQFTVTAAGHTITLHNGFNGSDSNLSSGVISGAQAIGAAGTITTFIVKVQETGKSAKNYTIDVSRAV
jgi:predicted secreted protein